jgi:hypothetical protein
MKLEPLYFDDARNLTGKAAPFILDVVKKGLSVTQATVVLLTMEDLGCLRERFRANDEPTHETQLTPRARQNVVFEAGMSMALRPKLTVLVEVGQHHHTISDLSGVHIIRMDNTERQRRLLAYSLQNAGCRVDQSGDEWKDKEKGGDFEAAAGNGLSAEMKDLLETELERLENRPEESVQQPLSPQPATAEYLEGLKLTPSTLLSLPDHLRKTAIIVCQLGEASAAEVAARSGRATAAESDYLNQLTRMGLLMKIRKGREAYFSAY